MEPLKLGERTGFIEKLPAESDWLHQGETGLVATIRKPGGDWRLCQPPGEWQRDMRTLFETEACVSFAFNDALETLLEFYRVKPEGSPIKPEDMQWLLDNGYATDEYFNFSDRFTAKMSGTSAQHGNSLPNVGQSIRTYGLVPESVWPSAFESLQPAPEVSGETAQNWAIYYADVPASAIALGEEFKRRFEVTYEWVVYPGVNMNSDGLRQQLEISPLVVATAVCMPWNTDQPIQGCGAGAAHATLLLNARQDGSYNILDHYQPFDKIFAPNYSITYAMRVMITSRTTPQPAPFQHTFNVNMKFGDPASPELHALQQALQTVVSKQTGKPYMKAGVFGPYGPQTRAAVAAFQADFGIVDPGGAGVDFGPQTRAAMNAALLANN